MKYYSANASVVTVRVRDGYWASSRQASYLASKLVWLLDLNPTIVHPAILHDLSSSDALSAMRRTSTHYHLTEYLRGSRDADKILRSALTPAQYKVIDEVSSFIAADHAGSNAPDAYLAVDLNTGRNLVLRPR